MVNPNKKVKRPNGLAEVLKYQEIEDIDKMITLVIEDIIDEYYVYLKRAIKKEGYYIAPRDTCFFFKEVLYDNEVVGFASYRPSGFNDKSLVMQYFYVLPEYRDKVLIEEEIDEASLLFESSILIEYPTRDVVESLIKHRMARVFNDRFVVSRIPFVIPMIPIEEFNEGVLREDYVNKDDKGYRKLSLIYDLDLCAVVGVAASDIENVYARDTMLDDEDINNYNVISLPLKTDNQKYDCISKRMNDPWIKDGTYFTKVDQIMKENKDIIENWLTIL